MSEEYYKYIKKVRHKFSLIRRARMNNIKHNFTYDEWQQKLFDTKGICPKCHKYIGIDKLTLDHIIPVSKAPEGFVYEIEDVDPLCLRCNMSKGARI